MFPRPGQHQGHESTEIEKWHFFVAKFMVLMMNEKDIKHIDNQRNQCKSRKQTKEYKGTANKFSKDDKPESRRHSYPKRVNELYALS